MYNKLDLCPLMQEYTEALKELLKDEIVISCQGQGPSEYWDQYRNIIKNIAGITGESQRHFNDKKTQSIEVYENKLITYISGSNKWPGKLQDNKVFDNWMKKNII